MPSLNVFSRLGRKSRESGNYEESDCSQQRKIQSNVLSEEDLKQLTGFVQQAALERHLNYCGIPYFRGRGKIYTTDALITEAGLAKAGMKQYKRAPV